MNVSFSESRCIITYGFGSENAKKPNSYWKLKYKPLIVFPCLNGNAVKKIVIKVFAANYNLLF